MQRRQLTYWVLLDTDPRYEVSNTGLLRRITPGPGTWPGRITQGAKRADGYLQVFGVRGGFNMMHQIVAYVFYGPVPRGCVPNHKDGVRHNNHKSNLEYITWSGNIKHGFDVLNPQNKAHRALKSSQNAAKARAVQEAKGWPENKYERSAELREHLHKLGKSQVQWWAKQGFSSLKAALDARKESLP